MKRFYCYFTYMKVFLLIWVIWIKIDKNATNRLYSFCIIFQPRRLFGSEDCFQCYLNQVPKPLSHSSYNLRVEKHWEYWLNYSNDLLVKSIEKFDILSYKAFLNTAFNKLVYTYVIVYVFVKQSRILHLFDLILGRIWCYSITVLICWE